MHEAATPSPPSSPRDARSKRRRILDAAQELLAERGFDAAPMEAIARRARVSRGTLYNCFVSKEDPLGEFREGLDPSDVALLLLAVFDGLEFRAASDPERVEPVRAFDVLPRLLDTGLRRASDRGRSEDA
jgi:AcrR family transcriptional regulator